MSQIGASPASFVVSTGDSDNASGSDTDYGDLTQGNVFPSSYLPKIGSRPIFAAQGNHGFTTNLPYLQNFPAPIAAQTSGGRNLQESYCCISTMSGAQNYASSWYAFDSGGARFYVLEAAWADGTGGYQGDFQAHWNGSVTGCGPCGAELAWLKSDLAAHASTPIKFAFFHYPLHADSSSQGSDTYLDGANGLEGLLADNNVDIVFNGHAHQYERNLPQIPGKPLVSYVTGAGGATLGSVSGCSAFDAYAVGTGLVVQCTEADLRRPRLRVPAGHGERQSGHGDADRLDRPGLRPADVLLLGTAASQRLLDLGFAHVGQRGGRLADLDHHHHRSDQRRCPVGGPERHRSAHRVLGLLHPVHRQLGGEFDHDRHDGLHHAGRVLSHHRDRHR